LVFLDPEQGESSESDDGLTKKLLPPLERRFNKIHTKAMKKAEKRITATKRASKRLLASIRKYAKKVVQ
jgi:hypothetical protein